MRKRTINLILGLVAIGLALPFAVAYGLHRYGLSMVDEMPVPTECSAALEGDLLDTWIYWGGAQPPETKPIGPIRYWFMFFSGEDVVPYNGPAWPGMLPSFHVARLHLVECTSDGGRGSELAEISLALQVVSNWSPCEIADYLKRKGPNPSFQADPSPRGRGPGPLNSKR